MSLDKTPEKIYTMFNLISEKYDFLNNVMSFGTQIFVKKLCIKLLDIKSQDKVLDLCTGTGDLARLIKKQSPKSIVTGIDFSEKMLEIAKNKGSDINYIKKDITDLPFLDNEFDFVTMGFGLRNIQNAEKAVEEVYRVLKSGGKFMHLDFGKKNLFSKIFDKITLITTKIFSNNPSAYEYLINSKQVFLTPEDLIKDFESKGFKLIRRKDFCFGIISCQILEKFIV